VRNVAVLCAAASVLSACRNEPGAGAGSASASNQPPPWDAGSTAPSAPKGMVWIPPGALVAGTPLDQLPRVADEEMAGEQVILNGFFISIYAYPNEEGAIPLASVTRDEAAALCQESGRRLCTELEWERACKGPSNHVYEYGDRDKPAVCGTGVEPRMLPSGLRVGCVSDFGVRDMHGSLWEWTASSWGRGQKADLVAVRGGNGSAGELVGRCANSTARSPNEKSGTVGFRCCAGPQNEAEVVVHVEHKRRLQRGESSDKVLQGAIATAVRESRGEEYAKLRGFQATELWYWRPVGNEELILAGGCSGVGDRRRCGAAIARLGQGGPDLLAFAGSGRFVPTVRTGTGKRELWVFGGDARSHYRRLVEYLWGRVGTGEIDRNVKGRR
jgi:sulfatase modifying factor 1